MAPVQRAGMNSRPKNHQPAVPRATYRVQLHADFDFDAAAAIVPYLARLGISHLYTSPITMARPGSRHGYDVVDHARVNPELGGDAGLDRLCGALREHDMALLVDFVPNHMGVGGAHNPYWLDVLEWGRESRYAEWMDIEWRPAEQTLADKLLVPFLGAPYGEVLESGELELRFEPASGSYAAWYHEHRFPICPRTYQAILAAAGDAAGEGRRLAGQVRDAPRGAASSAATALKAELRRLASEPEGRAALEAAATAFAGRPGEPATFHKLHALLEEQHYRVSYWRVAADEINYRRFFDINDLAGLCIENGRVFQELHALLFDLIRRGKVSGVRLDHVDGLFDPAAYCRSLQAEAGRCLGDPDAARPLYLLVEKILAPFERVPAEWPVHGTTGYDFMAVAAGLFVAADGEAPMTRSYARFVPGATDFETEVERAKPQILRNHLSSEFTVLARRLAQLAKRHPRTRDFTYQAIRQALTDIVARFPVYRTYIAEESASETDERYITWAVRRAIKSPGLVDDTVYEFIRNVLLARWGKDDGETHDEAGIRQIARKFQQLTGPVTAKSVEDTACYRYTRFVALNEVGSEPSRWGCSVAAFHHDAAGRRETAPDAMLATATHDHKRGEDVRARLAVLSEIPAEWARALGRFARLNRLRRRSVADEPVPARYAEYLFYQTVLGAWPMELSADDETAMAAFAARIDEYMIKAAREAKLQTHWARPDEAYEAGLSEFVHATLEPRHGGAFVREMARLVARVAAPGAVNGLAQAVLRCTVPGVPDLYQGTEGWDLSLVDPDNRRPVDYAARAAALSEVGDSDLRSVTGNWRDGRVKLGVIAALLAARARRPALFARGSYEPVEITGEGADRALAFIRRYRDAALLVMVPRLTAHAMLDNASLQLDVHAWADARLEPVVEAFAGARHLFTRERVEDVRADALLASFPVCVLEMDTGRGNRRAGTA
jgi:(1->4)-alpha-D-glucan 1-alpha-D-glucosylmutase